jgi:hypothetical protein
VRRAVGDDLKPVCVGQSHLVAVISAAQETGFALRSIALKDARGFRLAGAEPDLVAQSRRLDDALIRELTGPVFSFIGGMAHISLGLRQHPQPFDFVLPSEPDLPIDEGARVIPVSAMRMVIEQQASRHLKVFGKLVSKAPGPVFQMEPPPPASDIWLIGNLLGKRFGGKEERDTGKLAGPFLRYKLWRLNSEIVRSHTEKLGAAFVPAPEVAIDDEGFLRDEFCRNATHANAKYGELLLEQIKERMASLKALA